MLKRRYRLSARTKWRGKSIKTPFFILKVAQNGLLYNRFSFTVSKKVDKRAVVRNRVKRRLRSCIEEIFTDLKKGYDMGFLIKKEAVSTTTDKLCLLIKNTLKTEGVIERSQTS